MFMEVKKKQPRKSIIIIKNNLKTTYDNIRQHKEMRQSKTEYLEILRIFLNHKKNIIANQ